jgi:hypothetical protein
MTMLRRRNISTARPSSGPSTTGARRTALAPKLAVLGALAAATTAFGAGRVEAAPVQVSGVGVYDASATSCPAAPPTGYGDYTSVYPPLALTGRLVGCLYITVDAATDHGAPSGVYLEQGREVFIGRLDGGPVGTFTTTYRFESKWAPDVSTGVQLKGRCQHPIVAGSGTGGFAGATGRIDFKDDVGTGTVDYRGHITL